MSPDHVICAGFSAARTSNFVIEIVTYAAAREIRIAELRVLNECLTNSSCSRLSQSFLQSHNRAADRRAIRLRHGFFLQNCADSVFKIMVESPRALASKSNIAVVDASSIDLVQARSI